MSNKKKVIAIAGIVAIIAAIAAVIIITTLSASNKNEEQAAKIKLGKYAIYSDDEHPNENSDSIYFDIKEDGKCVYSTVVRGKDPNGEVVTGVKTYDCTYTEDHITIVLSNDMTDEMNYTINGSIMTVIRDDNSKTAYIKK